MGKTPDFPGPYPDQAEARWLVQYLSIKDDLEQYYFSATLAGFDPPALARLLTIISRRITDHEGDLSAQARYKQLLCLLASKNPAWTEGLFVEVLEAVATDYLLAYRFFPLVSLLSKIKEHIKGGPLPGAIHTALLKVHSLMPEAFPLGGGMYEDGFRYKIVTQEGRRMVLPVLTKDALNLRQYLAEFLGLDQGRGPLDYKEPWTDYLLSELKDMDASLLSSWTTLLEQAAKVPAGFPAKGKWADRMSSMASELPEGQLQSRLLTWTGKLLEMPSEHMNPSLSDLIVGMAWLLGWLASAQSAQALGNMALEYYKKVPGVGCRSSRVGNACVHALGRMHAPEAASELTRLRLKVKRPLPVATLIAKTLAALANARGMSLVEMEDRNVSTFGFSTEGTLSRSFGECTALATITSGAEIHLQWCKPTGQVAKGLPLEVKAGYPEELKELKADLREAGKVLAMQRMRLEQAYMLRRVWGYTAWRTYILDHPLVGTYARRLIWRFEGQGRATSGLLYKGSLVGHDGSAINWIDNETRVRLWHPWYGDPHTSTSWRSFIEQHDITQPFKQAHREIYQVTEAEESTDNHSRRFQGYLLRQHQLQALCQSRGWRYSLQGDFDNVNNPTFHIDGMAVELEVEPANFEGHMTGRGIARYVHTGPLVFRKAGVPVRLTEVEGLLFSEVLRDVDLFVSVANVGLEQVQIGTPLHAAWQDSWERFALGPLLPSAEERREVLARLLPKFGLSGCSSIQDKHLVVRGRLATYRIHLGSGLVYMEPANHVLCIVQASRATHFFAEAPLPYEGDHMLSLILSKALLLASDDKIKDSSILSQIKRALPPKNTG